MAKFGQVTARQRKPPRTTEVTPGEFCSTWPRIPKAPIVVGIRRLADADETIAIAGAAKTASDLYQGDDPETYERVHADAILRHVVNAAVCDPNDVTRTHRAFPIGEENVRLALTSACLRRLYDEIERVTIETSPLYPEATDQEIGALVGRLMTGEELGALPSGQQNRVRRYLRFALDELHGDEQTVELDLDFLDQ